MISKRKKSVVELGHNDHSKIYVYPSKIYVDPVFQVHLNGLFSETTALMVLKFHMQHDQTLGLQNDKIPPGREAKMTASAKNSKINKINFFSRMAWYIRLIFCMKHQWNHAFENYKMKKLGHSDLLPVYESNFAEMPISLLLKIAKNIKQTLFYELPNGF